MSIEKIFFTKVGFDRLQLELDNYKQVERPTIIKAIAEARALGDLSENAEYHAAREKQGFIEARIADLEGNLSRAEVVDYSQDSLEVVKFSAHVKLEDEETGEEKSYQLVNDLEANIREGRISINSPIGKALVGKKQDDLVLIRIPKGEVEYTIRGIKY